MRVVTDLYDRAVINVIVDCEFGNHNSRIKAGREFSSDSSMASTSRRDSGIKKQGQSKRSV
jgi:hypothetical protein